MQKKLTDLFMYALGALIVIGFFVLLGFLVVYEVPPQNMSLLQIVVGALIGSFTAIVGYFFGSSKGSKDKTEIIAKNGK